MKKILGLDLGTNSIGWAVVSADIDSEGNENLKKIESAGSRIIPMDAALLGDFDKGNLKTQTAERTRLRGVRRLNERYLIRRERLLRVLSLMNFLPEHYAGQLDRYGKFVNHAEPKLAWCRNEHGSYEFLFQKSFQEMLEDFYKHYPDLKDSGKRIPYDWTLYYLRKKALKEAISKEELAWLLLNFNQKRGYYQLRDEKEEEQSNKDERYYALKVVDVVDTGEKRGRDVWYNVILENGWIYRRANKTPLTEWIGKVKEFIVSTALNDDGTPKLDKEGQVKRSFRAPNPDDWMLLKKKTEYDIEQSHKFIGEYVYDTLLADPKQKIRGRLVSTIDRHFYKEELTQILQTQQKFHQELQDNALYQACLDELYPLNEAHRRELSSRDFVYFLRDDVLFYQRPLKSKKSLIAECPYETRCYVDKQTGELHRQGLKCIAKSHPLYQEFRLWQFVANLRIYQREKYVNGKLCLDVDVTSEFLQDEESKADLFAWLAVQKQIKQEGLLKYPGFHLAKKEISGYRWNYVEDNTYPCNETYAQLVSYLKKAGISSDVMTADFEEALWHILYSVSDKQELVKALTRFGEKYQLPKEFVEVFAKMPTYERSYGSYSAKALKRLLPLMRMGRYWSEDAIDGFVKDRIQKLVDGECDETITLRVREKAISLRALSDFRALPLWLASYVVYNRHSEAKDIVQWKTPEDIDAYLQQFKQYSLRNPIVEQVVLETLRTVRDIWKQEGHIDEIHVELGREMKNPKDKRIKITQQVSENENTNLRIKALLLEFMNPEFEIEGVRPHSPSQQELLKIYEDTVLNSASEIPDDIASIMKRLSEQDIKKRPSRSEVMRYKLWLEQGYRSPYTGSGIPLGKLFTPAYEIEHIIPQRRYFDDSLSNKVICEAEVNKLKSSKLGYEFIQQCHGQKVLLSSGKTVTVFSMEDYEKFVKEHYSSPRLKSKMNKLLMDDIPEAFINRQLNDSRYISKLVKSLLSNIVREDDEQEETSKHVIGCVGSVTDRLKKDWGMNDVWNKIVMPRFLRMNEITGTTAYTTTNTQGQLIPIVPFEHQKGFNKKRIDHRHHAMDAIVIACATRNIVNYLSNSNAASQKGELRYDLQAKLCSHKQIIDKPWDTFTTDAYEALQQIVVSFKHNQRIINKTVNRYQHYDETGQKKILVKQTKGTQWAIRKPMHKDTVFGEINLRKVRTVALKQALEQLDRVVDKELKRQLKELVLGGADVKTIQAYFDSHTDLWEDVNLKKIEVYYFTKETNDRFFASRTLLDDSFDEARIRDKVADTGIQKILLRHLQENGNDPKVAFSPEGIERMNAEIVRLNDNHFHQPILKVRQYERADKFAIGTCGNKSTKFVEASKGTNLFYAVYESVKQDKKTGELIRKRSYETIPLNVVVERLKEGLPVAPECKDDDKLLFVLSPNDLVYVPTLEEIRTNNIHYPVDKSRIYKMVSSSDKDCFFVSQYVSGLIVNKKEFSTSNKMEKTITGETIKKICIPIQVDRLGNIIDSQFSDENRK